MYQFLFHLAPDAGGHDGSLPACGSPILQVSGGAKAVPLPQRRFLCKIGRMGLVHEVNCTAHVASCNLTEKCTRFVPVGACSLAYGIKVGEKVSAVVAGFWDFGKLFDLYLVLEKRPGLKS